MKYLCTSNREAKGWFKKKRGNTEGVHGGEGNLQLTAPGQQSQTKAENAAKGRTGRELQNATGQPQKLYDNFWASRGHTHLGDVQKTEVL